MNVVGELQRKRTLAASRGFLAAARLSCTISDSTVQSLAISWRRPIRVQDCIHHASVEEARPRSSRRRVIPDHFQPDRFIEAVGASTISDSTVQSLERLAARSCQCLQVAAGLPVCLSGSTLNRDGGPQSPVGHIDCRRPRRPVDANATRLVCRI